MERINILNILVSHIQQKQNKMENVNLNFICTHNSRRSQFAQIWGQTAAYYYGIEVNCYSGGVEEMAFNERAVNAILRAGFKATPGAGNNPRYNVSFSEDTEPLIMFSKIFDDKSNPTSDFVAVMTCSDADANCPFIPGTEARIPLLYDDPKEYDGTSLEAHMYDTRSRQIATELFYVFSKIVK